MKKRWKSISTAFVILFVCLGFSEPAEAWNATGHIIIAQIAYNNLTNVAKNDVDYLVNKTYFASDFPQFLPYVYSASWPDYLKYNLKAPRGKTEGIFDFLRAETKAWHYYNQPFVIGHYTPNPVSVNNSIWAVNFLVPNLSMLIREKKYDQAAYALIFLTHIVGDLHQPLHNSDFYDADFPHGDIGGNLYKIKKIYGANELHALWDKSLGHFSSWKGDFRKGVYRPPQKNVEETANQFQTLCGTVTDLNPADWENSSHQIAVNYVYPVNNSDAPGLNQKVSSTYISHGRQIAAKQMCLAGKRLAAILNQVFTKPIFNY